MRKKFPFHQKKSKTMRATNIPETQFDLLPAELKNMLVATAEVLPLEDLEIIESTKETKCPLLKVMTTANRQVYYSMHPIGQLIYSSLKKDKKKELQESVTSKPLTRITENTTIYGILTGADLGKKEADCYYRVKIIEIDYLTDPDLIKEMTRREAEAIFEVKNTRVEGTSIPLVNSKYNSRTEGPIDFNTKKNEHLFLSIIISNLAIEKNIDRNKVNEKEATKLLRELKNEKKLETYFIEKGNYSREKPNIIKNIRSNTPFFLANAIERITISTDLDQNDDITHVINETCEIGESTKEKLIFASRIIGDVIDPSMAQYLKSVAPSQGVMPQGTDTAYSVVEGPFNTTATSIHIDNNAGAKESIVFRVKLDPNSPKENEFIVPALNLRVQNKEVTIIAMPGNIAHGGFAVENANYTKNPSEHSQDRISNYLIACRVDREISKRLAEMIDARKIPSVLVTAFYSAKGQLDLTAKDKLQIRLVPETTYFEVIKREMYSYPRLPTLEEVEKFINGNFKIKDAAYDGMEFIQRCSEVYTYFCYLEKALNNNPMRKDRLIMAVLEKIFQGLFELNSTLGKFGFPILYRLIQMNCPFNEGYNDFVYKAITHYVHCFEWLWGILTTKTKNKELLAKEMSNISVISKKRKRDDNSPLNIRNKGLISIKKGRFEEAKKYFERLIEDTKKEVVSNISLADKFFYFAEANYYLFYIETKMNLFKDQSTIFLMTALQHFDLASQEYQKALNNEKDCLLSRVNQLIVLATILKSKKSNMTSELKLLELVVIQYFSDRAIDVAEHEDYLKSLHLLQLKATNSDEMADTIENLLETIKERSNQASDQETSGSDEEINLPKKITIKLFEKKSNTQSSVVAPMTFFSREGIHEHIKRELMQKREEVVEEMEQKHWDFS